MKLPYRKNAIVEKEKLTNYLLLETHPIGGSKARFFRKLGFEITNIAELTEALLEIAQSDNVRQVRQVAYGTNYAIEGTIETPTGRKVMITTIWFIGIEKNKPRFVTAYPV